MKQSLLYAIASAAAVALAAPSPQYYDFAPARAPIFGPYKEVYVATDWDNNVFGTAVTGTQQDLVTALDQIGLEHLTWAFALGECGSENWGGIAGADAASANVQKWVKAGKKYTLSFGGADGAWSCTSDANFEVFLDRYMSSSFYGVDFDIENGQDQTFINGIIQRVKNAQAKPKYSHLKWSFTVGTFGEALSDPLGTYGDMVMTAIKKYGLKDYTINIMTMDYGGTQFCTDGSNGQCDMGASAVQAAKDLNGGKYRVPYNQIELTPMIGGNDSANETFTIANVATVSEFAKQVGIAGVHFWSFDRDSDCAAGTGDVSNCNDYGQAGTLGFTKGFLKHL